MPVTVSYPGVYIQEVPSGVRTITGVATSVAAFVDYFKWGPVNRGVQCSSMADFEREFGGLDTKSESSYAIQQFFANGGAEAWVVRVVTNGVAATDFAQRAAVRVRPNLTSSTVLTVEAISEGAWGNRIGVKVDHDAPVAGEFNMTVTYYESVGGKETAAKTEMFRNLSMTPTAANFVDRILNDAVAGSKLIHIPSPGTGAGTRPLLTGTQSNDVIEPITLGATPNLNVAIATPPAVLTPVAIQLSSTSTTRDQVAVDLQERIRAAQPSNPQFANVTVTVQGQRFVIRTSPNPADRIVFTEGSGTTAATLRLLNPPAANPATSNVQEYRLGGGTITDTAQVVATNGVGQDGIRPNPTTLIGSLLSKTGMYALEDVDLFNILCLPRAAMVHTTGNEEFLDFTQGRTIISAAETYCETRRAFLIVDTPLDHDDPAEIRTWLAGGASVRHKNAALYYPRVQLPDPLDNSRLRSFGASGTIAGLYARTDSARGVWKAPAGTEASLRNVSALEDMLTDPENGTLNPLAINALRNFPIYGPVCWGARTLDGADQQASEWKYVPVRRIALFLEESLYRGTKWVVFEPNDEPLWAQVRLNIGAFMQNLFRQGAFQGQTPRDAYFVKCDKETTTQTDINSGIVNIVVGFAPLKPAEFVVIKIQQMAGQIAT